MAWMPYSLATALSQNLKSETCVQVSPSLWMAASQASFLPGWSSETPNTVKPFSLYFAKAFTRFGFWARQGPHQLAQKSTSTYLPLKAESFIRLPEVSGCSKSGATLPMAVILSAFTLSTIRLPKGVDL